MLNQKSNEKKLEFKHIAITHLMPGEYQPRKQFDPIALDKLAETIKEVGILMPLLVRPRIGDSFEIIAGERRWRAAQIAELTEVPCLISVEPDKLALIKGLIENLSRENLNPIEEAKGIERLIEEFNCTHLEVAKYFGKSRAEISNLLRLLDLHDNVKLLLIDRDLNETHGRLLASLPQEEQYLIARKAVAKKWSTRALEREIQGLKNPLGTVSKNDLSADSKRLEFRLSEYLAARVKLDERGKQTGEIHIPYNSLDELEGILIKIGFMQKDDDEYDS